MGLLNSPAVSCPVMSGLREGGSARAAEAETPFAAGGWLGRWRRGWLAILLVDPFFWAYLFCHILVFISSEPWCICLCRETYNNKKKSCKELWSHIIKGLASWLCVWLFLPSLVNISWGGCVCEVLAQSQFITKIIFFPLYLGQPNYFSGAEWIFPSSFPPTHTHTHHSLVYYHHFGFFLFF